MADEGFRAGPQLLTTSPVTIYSVPSATDAHILHYRVVNISDAVAKLTMSVGTDAAGTRYHDGQDIPAHGVLNFSGFLWLDAHEDIEAFADITSVLVITISGVEVK